MQQTRPSGPPENRLLLLIVLASALVVAASVALNNTQTTAGMVAAGLAVGALEGAIVLAWFLLKAHSIRQRMLFMVALLGLLAWAAVLANTSSQLDDLVWFFVSAGAIVCGIVLAFLVARKWRSGEVLPILLIVFSSVVVTVSIVLASEHARIEDLLLAGLLAFIISLTVTLLLWPIWAFSTGWFRRRATNRIIISQIATVVRQNLPLATGLSLAAEAERGWARRNLRQIARLIAEGSPLSTAIATGYPDCPSLPLSLVIAGEKAGQLTAALDQAEEHLLEQRRRTKTTDISVLGYVLVLTSFATLVVSGIMVAVVPKFKEIFKDFGVRLPASTMSLIDFCEFVLSNPALYLLPAVGIPLAIYWSVRPRRVPNLAWSSRAADWIRWHTPGWRRLEKARSLRTVLRVMGLGVRSGMGLDVAARLAEGVDVNAQLRPRVHQFAELLVQGLPIRDAAREAELGEVTATALSGGQRANDMGAALRYAADYQGALASRAWIVLRAMTLPGWTILMGLMVGWVVYSLFHPLVALIDSISF